MKKQFSLIILTLLISLFLNAGTCSATGGIPLDEVHEGIVSGGVYFDSYYGFGDQTQYQPNTVVESFTFPEDAEETEWAMLLVTVYCGSMTNDYKGYANVSFGNTILGNESLSITLADTSENVNRVTSDYVICYDVTDLAQAGENVATVKTGQIDSNFDGRIKLVTLVAAYNDSSEDNVWYQVNQGIEPANGNTDFDVDLILPAGFALQNASLTSVYLASSDGIYTFNDDSLSSGVPLGDYSGSNVWNVTAILDLTETNTMTYDKSGYYKIVLGILSAESQEESTATADLNISDISVFHNSYEGAWEDLDNTVNITVRNEGYDVVNDVPVSFYEDGMEIQSKTIEELSSGDEAVVSFTWMPDDAKTYTLKAIVDPDITINDADRTNNEYSIDQSVLHNGYMGDKPLTNYVHGTVRGNISYDYGDSTYKSGLLPDESYTVNHALSLPEGATVKLARLYTFWTWSCIGTAGTFPEMKLDINGNVITTEDEYNDIKGWGSYSDIPSGMWAYNVTEYVIADGDYLTTITNTNTDSNAKFSISGVALLVIYEDPNGQEIEYWINEGADMISTISTSGGLISEEATTTASFEESLELTAIESANLWTIVQSGNGLNTILHFNEMEWAGVYDGTPSINLDIDEARTVRDYLNAEDNVVQISAADDYLVPCGAILVATYQDEYYADLNVSNVTVSHNSYEAAWENLNNTVNVTVTNEGTKTTGNFVLELFANDTLVESKTISGLSAGETTFVNFIWKPEETGTYTLKAVADSENIIIETDETNNEYSIDKSVLHNGYMGDNPLTTYAHGSVLGDVIYDHGDSYYRSGFKYGDVYKVNHTLSLPDGATVKLARLYTYWTYCKADPSEIKLNFNGTAIDPENTYIDSKGWGSYNYPYGTFAYNVTDNVAESGNYLTTVLNNNTEGKTVGIYGVSLLVISEGSDGQEIEYWINEGADLLYSNSKYSGGLTSEEATSTAAFEGAIDLSDIESAKLWTIVPSGNKAGNTLYFNNMNWSGIYNGTPYNDLDVDEKRNVTDYLKPENNLVHISAASPEEGGDTLMPTGAILVLTIDDSSEDSISSKESSGGSSSGRSSGGGGGSTGEKYENILVKDVESVYIYKDTHIVYEFSEEGNAITSVQFDGLKNSGSIKTIVEVLKARSSFADTDAPGEVYQQMNIWVGNTGFVSSDSVENLAITFKVERSWIEESNIDKDNVNLYRYSDDSWNLLSTTITDEDDTYVYFEAKTTGFSPFAIAGKAIVETVEDSDTSLYSTTEETIDSIVEIETDAETSSALPGFEILLAGAGLAISGLLIRRKIN